MQSQDSLDDDEGQDGKTFDRMREGVVGPTIIVMDFVWEKPSFPSSIVFFLIGHPSKFFRSRSVECGSIALLCFHPSTSLITNATTTAQKRYPIWINRRHPNFGTSNLGEERIRLGKFSECRRYSQSTKYLTLVTPRRSLPRCLFLSRASNWRIHSPTNCRLFSRSQQSTIVI